MQNRAIAVIPAYSHIDARLYRVLMQVGLPYIEVYGCSDLVRVRSGLVSDALRTDAGRIIFIDSDMIPTAEDLIELIETPRVDAQNSVSGSYVVRGGKIAACAETGPILASASAQASAALGTSERYEKLLVAGMGFAAVDRAPLERLRLELPELLDDTGKSWSPFFLPLVIQQEVDGSLLSQYLAEDYSFWWRLRAIGVDLWLDHRLQIGHVKPEVLYPRSVQVQQ